MKGYVLLISTIFVLFGCNGSDSNTGSTSNTNDAANSTRKIDVFVDPDIQIPNGSKIMSSVGEASVSPNGSRLDVIDVDINNPRSDRNMLLLVNSNDEVILMGYEDGKNVIDAESTVNALLFLALGGTADIQNMSAVGSSTSQDELIGLPIRNTPTRAEIINNIKNSPNYINAVQTINDNIAQGSSLASITNISPLIYDLIVNDAKSRYQLGLAKNSASRINNISKTNTIFINADPAYTPLTEFPLYLYGGKFEPGTAMGGTQYGISGAKFFNRSPLYWHITTNEGGDVIMDPSDTTLGTAVFGGVTSYADLNIQNPDTVTGRVFQDKNTQTKNVISAVFTGVNEIFSFAIGATPMKDKKYLECTQSAILTVFNEARMNQIISKENPSLMKETTINDWLSILDPSIKCLATASGRVLVGSLSRSILSFGFKMVPIYRALNSFDSAYTVINIFGDLALHNNDTYILLPIPDDQLSIARDASLSP